MYKKLNIKIKSNNKNIKIFLNNKEFFNQKILLSNNKFLNNKTYTLFYVLKIMYRFGLISSISKKFGF